MIIGIGTDIIEIARIEEALSKTEHFFSKVYTENERQYYLEKRKKAETLAGWFCAKEAVSKALGTGFRQFGLRDIEVLPNALGKPEIRLYGKAEALKQSLGITEIQVTIAHCKSYATAFAIAEGVSLK